MLSLSGDTQMKEKMTPRGQWLYPRRPAPGRGWCRPWRQSCWSAASGWRLGGTCWGCWCPSSPSTGRTSPGARRPEPRPRVHGRAAAAAAGAGFSPVPSGTAGAGAAAADACSGKRNTRPDRCGVSPGARGEQGYLCQRSRRTLCDPQGGGNGGKHRRQGLFNGWLSPWQLDFPGQPILPTGD